jgi:hypothetical protein
MASVRRLVELRVVVTPVQVATMPDPKELALLAAYVEAHVRTGSCAP